MDTEHITGNAYEILQYNIHFWWQKILFNLFMIMLSLSYHLIIIRESSWAGLIPKNSTQAWGAAHKCSSLSLHAEEEEGCSQAQEKVHMAQQKLHEEDGD